MHKILTKTLEVITLNKSPLRNIHNYGKVFLPCVLYFYAALLEFSADCSPIANQIEQSISVITNTIK